jgi:predicted naringenin-chalcone synthase
MSFDLFYDEDEYQLKKIQLLYYLDDYISKKFNMNEIFESISERVKSDEKITLNQFLSIIKFLEKEKPFLSKNRIFIKEYFQDFIHIKPKKKEKKKYESNLNLLKFLK